ncbi:putative bifunctional diguanylate cyclase/phosphodiesterase [Pilimelia columellifera]|uniref:EAL domain-containing protein n=1 Tax=Pilimelia columellifera subsp. columellifera TaxID=706583 RepID=A0ABN3NDV0_9ACTN
MAYPRAVIARSPALAWFVTVPLGLTAVIVAFYLQPTLDLLVDNWVMIAIYFALFVAADATRLRVEVRRQAFTLTLVEIPLLLAFFYLPAPMVPLVRLAAAVCAQVVSWRRGQSAIKSWFNVAAQFASTSLAALIVAGNQPLVADQLETWLILGLSVAANFVVTMVSVTLVIGLVQGWMSGADLARTVTPSLAVTTVNITVGLVILLVLQQNPWGVVLLASLLIFFVIAYRSYSQFMRQHHTLQELYDLTASVRDTRHEATLYDQILHGTRRMLSSEHATLWLPETGRHPEVLLTSKAETAGLLDLPGTPDLIRRRVFAGGRTVAVGAHLGDELRADLRAAGVKDAIAVPLTSGQVTIGCLEVAGRLGDTASFQPEDVRLLETVAAHVAVAVENARLVDRLRFDAYHDALTGLPNRRRLLQALEESVRVRAPGEVVAVLLFDVDGLRDVNDSLGHAAGDTLLAEVSRRLRGLAPAAALVGRVGGDEFAVTLRMENAEAALVLAARLREELRVPMEFGTLTLDVDTAVGVVVHPDHGSDPAALLQRADVAARAAELLPSAVQSFHPSLESRSVRRLGLANDLRRAIDNDELEIYFQPQVSLGDRHLVGVECLARWEHPTHGAVAPQDFVAVAEHTGQLSRLTEAVLREGLRRCKQWVDAGRPLNVAVNLSSRTLVDAAFPDRVAALIREFGVPPERVTFEIAEDGVVGAPDRPLPTLRRLHDIGVRLSVDDFGTGYSSLSQLRRLPVQEVKIDRTFVQGMATDAGDLAIVRAVVDLARHFGLTVVAEGVESELTLDLLREIGCDTGQGFLFSRPLPYERLEAWLRQQTEAAPSTSGEVRRLRAVP